MTVIQHTATTGATKPKIMASMLTADLSRLGEECLALSEAGVDGIHWDLMDGIAVPSLSFGPDVVAACRRHVALPFEAHVMSRVPETFIDGLARAGCESLTLHTDWVQNPRRTLQRIVDAGMTAGVALSPGTPIDFALWHQDLIGLVLVMTVEPGFGGQAHIPLMSRKVAELAELTRELDRPIVIEVDGGIAPETIGPMQKAGARAHVVGSALWRFDSFAAAVTNLRSAASGATTSDHT